MSYKDVKPPTAAGTSSGRHSVFQMISVPCVWGICETLEGNNNPTRCHRDILARCLSRPDWRSHVSNCKFLLLVFPNLKLEITQITSGLSFQKTQKVQFVGFSGIRLQPTEHPSSHCRPQRLVSGACLVCPLWTAVEIWWCRYRRLTLSMYAYYIPVLPVNPPESYTLDLLMCHIGGGSL